MLISPFCFSRESITARVGGMVSNSTAPKEDVILLPFAVQKIWFLSPSWF